jgi:hypothetical protein
MTEARGWKLAAFAQVVRSPLYAEVMICKTVGSAPESAVYCSVSASEALGRDAEFVAFRILHHGPALAWDLMLADDRAAKPNELVNR